jgi:hypothetical protein
MAMYGIEKWCISLKYYRQYLREGSDGHVWFRHFFHGQRSTMMNILHYCSVLYCCFFFLLLTSLLCSFLFLQIKEIKLNILNTVKENQIYFVLSCTFEPFSFFLPPFLLPFFVDLCSLSSQKKKFASRFLFAPPFSLGVLYSPNHLEE